LVTLALLGLTPLKCHSPGGLTVDHISARAMRVLNLTRRNIYSCLLFTPAATKALTYTSLVRPHLEFASAAWDPYTESDSYKIDKVQQRAACFVNRDYRRITSVSHMSHWPLEDEPPDSLCSTKGCTDGLEPIPVDQLRHPFMTTRHSTTFVFQNRCFQVFFYSEGVDGLEFTAG
jgi:hypothetical protein